ncbi:MAG: acyl carrier protein [Bacteroidales bacterium]|nr:acyl carrier protein [Bacteroidales bacterium]
MTQNEIFEGLKEVILVIRPKTDLSSVTLETRLVEQLGIDSLSMMLLALACENKFSIRFENSTPFATVGDVCDYIQQITNK